MSRLFLVEDDQRDQSDVGGGADVERDDYGHVRLFSLTSSCVHPSGVACDDFCKASGLGAASNNHRDVPLLDLIRKPRNNCYAFHCAQFL
jgi:hypothetical protein